MLSRRVVLLTMVLLSNFVAGWGQPLPDRHAVAIHVRIDGIETTNANITISRAEVNDLAVSWGLAAQTDRHGVFVIPDMEEGVYRANLENAFNGGGANGFQSADFTVGKDTTSVFIDLCPRVEITLTVNDADGKPLANKSFQYRIIATSNDGTVSDSLGMRGTDANGQVSMNGYPALAPGKYRIYLSAPDAYCTAPCSLDLSHGGPRRATMQLQPSSPFTVRVLETNGPSPAGDANAQAPAHPAGGQPVQVCAVATKPEFSDFFQPGRKQPTILTNEEDGLASLYAVPPGTYQVLLPGVASADIIANPPVVVADGKTTAATVYIKPQTRRYLTIKVIDREGKPMAHTLMTFALFCYAQPNRGQPQRRARTDADGNITLHVLTPGHWNIFGRAVPEKPDTAGGGAYDQTDVDIGPAGGACTLKLTSPGPAVNAPPPNMIPAR